MFHLSKVLRCQRVHLIIAKYDGKSYVTSGESGRADFRTRKRRIFTVRETRGGGEPSASANLKEALCEKIPVHHDLLRKFRRHFGPTVVSQITVDNLYEGLNGVRSIVKETARVDPKHGIIYRGLTIPEVIALLPRRGNSPSAEAVFWLLLTGDVPTQRQTASLIADWASRRRRCAERWSVSRGGEAIASVLRSLPETTTTTTPLHRLSVALAIFDVGKREREAKKHGAMPYTYWEYTYEDCMEFLATLPAIVALTAKGEVSKNVSGDGDWVEFFLDCLNGSLDGSSAADFLRLYITLNADDDGGAPAAHITQILGSTDLRINEVLASSVLAYADEPKSGTMSQWRELQVKIQNRLGRMWTERSLEDCVLSLWSRDKLLGHRNADFCDPRYTALLEHAKQYLPDDVGIKLSRDITRILRRTLRRPTDKEIYPEQNSIAPIIFQHYGLKDMRFNQTILYMARTLGAIATIIWMKVVNAPVEHPISNSTNGYIELIHDDNVKRKKRKTYL